MDKIEMQQPFFDWRGRNYRRFKLEFPVRLRYEIASKATEVEGVSKNLSVGGLLVRSIQPVPQHTTVSFVLSVHGSQSLRPIHLSGRGEIVRLENGEAEGIFVMAVKCDSPVTQLEEYLPL